MTTIKKTLKNKNLNEINAFIDQVKIKIGFLGSRRFTCDGYQGSFSLNYLLEITGEKSKEAQSANQISEILNKIKKLDQLATCKLEQTKIVKFFHFIPHLFGKILSNKSKAEQFLKQKEAELKRNPKVMPLEPENDLESEIQAYLEPKSDATEVDELRRIQFLLDKGVNVNRKLNHYSPETELHRAIKHNREEVVKLLIKNGADISIPDAFANPPLQIAFIHKNYAIMELFLKAGANINLVTRYSETLLQQALEKNDTEMVEFLVEHHADVNYHTPETSSPLIMAIRSGNYPHIQLLLDRGANIHENHYGKTGLHVAITMHDMDMVKFLINNGAHCDTSFISSVLESKKWDIAEFLLQVARSKQQINDNQITTEFLRVMETGELKAVQLLIENGANPNGIDKKFPPLFIAILKNYHQITEYLLQNGASINLEWNGFRAIDKAIELQNATAVKLLLDHGVQVTDEILKWAKEFGNTDILTLLQK
ncbi:MULTISPECIES: ankyrin repeat domain-containing protein [Parachlamydia]|jgi:ankyrin repeat protein|uniref:ankyrin repeat domain-containing protein n=1 Tax=Parachlamydia TaxID=83551 RepID=UPI0001C17738|nr:ankyrin repeat domain-containing protein [Parachlamydia acanthamoebae]EFB41046.1 hypothetical protein pah_c052o004 [Parachlamydia acanthamoebae str. Hall's coccus]